MNCEDRKQNEHPPFTRLDPTKALFDKHVKVSYGVKDCSQHHLANNKQINNPNLYAFSYTGSNSKLRYDLIWKIAKTSKHDEDEEFDLYIKIIRVTSMT